MLSRPDLQLELDRRRLIIDPAPSLDSIGQVSIDLRLGRRFTILKSPPSYIGSVNVDSSIWAAKDLWEQVDGDSFVLDPQHFVLAQTLEIVRMPEHLAGFVEGRSSWARLGITIHVTAPKIDPGFSGTITLEMMNFGALPIRLRAGFDRPAQLMLFRISTPLAPDDRYGANPSDIFQNQSSPTPGGDH